VNHPLLENGPSASSNALQEWTVALGGAEDADQGILHGPRGEVPAFMAVDFLVPPVPEQSCPLPSYDMPGHSKEVLWRLCKFLAAKPALRRIVGSRVGEQFVLDFCGLDA